MQAVDSPLLQGARVKIFLGEFGSGKTELAVNYALQIKALGCKTAIVDIDLVKPCFRTRENRKLLEKNEIEVVAPEQRLENADLPVLPHNLTRVLSQQDYQVVMDVGGGKAAIVLGQFSKLFASNPYQAMLVVNTCRPFTSTVAAIVELFHCIEHASRLKITGIISNTNLAGGTNEQHIQTGLAIAEAASAELAVPIHSVVIPEWLAGKVSTHYPIFVLKPYTQYPWMV
ncbi:hypothetical protein [Sporomusa termitida]|uniref:CobQ/CobB/MinD/ParA nucleotide binding domain-containing protein n=1 Tax=Sporomusa termitida TaxID=2377 RepID=A0A517DYL1_9FIRM|nr:hypothetical protein [Sporomusa termitida]QDR82423.1 hypothetical protein SPTER_38510 [Sporomusa termitida]